MQGLPRRLAIIALARMRPFRIVGRQPAVHIDLQLLQADVHLAPKCMSIQLILDCLVEMLADPVGLPVVLVRLCSMSCQSKDSSNA